MFSALHASLPQRSLLRSAPLTPRNALIPQCDISVHSGEELGAGRLGSVAGASWLEQPCAIKRIIPSSEERNNPGVGKRLKEVEELIPHLCHPNLLPLYGICEQPDSRALTESVHSVRPDSEGKRAPKRAMMKLKRLVELLQHVPEFAAPDYEAEQYKTSADLAATIVFAAERSYGDVAGRLVADLGCGTGVLALACAALGAALVVGVDLDGAALEQCRATADELGLGGALDLVRADVLALAAGLGASGAGAPLHCKRPLAPPPLLPPVAELEIAAAASPPAAQLQHVQAISSGPFDTVIMNPPFGTRRAGADVAFLRAALALAAPRGVVYSLHKSSTRAHLVRCAAGWGVGCEVVAELRFEIPATYAFHREASRAVAVDLLRFTKGLAQKAMRQVSVSVADSVAVDREKEARRR